MNLLIKHSFVSFQPNSHFLILTLSCDYDWYYYYYCDGSQYKAHFAHLYLRHHWESHLHCLYIPSQAPIRSSLGIVQLVVSVERHSHPGFQGSGPQSSQ